MSHHLTNSFGETVTHIYLSPLSQDQQCGLFSTQQLLQNTVLGRAVYIYFMEEMEIMVAELLEKGNLLCDLPAKVIMISIVWIPARRFRPLITGYRSVLCHNVCGKCRP